MRSLLFFRSVYMYNNELMHFGRSKKNGAPGRGSGRYPLGSGENPRSSRNKSLTDDEKREYVKSAAAENAYRKTVVNNSKTKYAKDLADETGRVVRSLKQQSDDLIRNGVKKQKLDLSKMSDKEMRDKINRELLERQYNQLFAPEVSTVSKGEIAVNKALAIGGTVLAATSSALGIALTIKQLRGK